MTVSDMWKGKRTGTGLRWMVRYRDERGRQRKERFATRPEADLFDAKMRMDPTQRRKEESLTLTVDQMMEKWLSTKGDLEPSTLKAYRQDVDQVTKAFGDRLASSLMPSEVRAWSARIRLGASGRRRSLVALRAAYQLALDDKLVTEDPTKGAKLPSVHKTDQRFLTWAELAALAEAAGSYFPLIYVLGTCGLRLEEAVALDASDINRDRQQLHIRKTKNHESRDVPIMGWILALLPDTEGPVFRSPRGQRLSGHNFRERHFADAAATAGLAPLKPHELRHTAASLAIASGADIKEVQNMLGHKDANMTLNLYGHLMPKKDSVATRMEKARRKELKRSRGRASAIA